MTDADRPRLAQFLAVLGETFNEPISELRAESYFLALADLDIAALERIAHPALNLKFFPRPADLRQLVEGASEHAADAAWLLVLREMRRVGYCGKPELPEAAMATIQGLWGSWVHLCSSLPADGPEFLGWAKQFRASYSATKERIDRDELIGRDDAEALLGSLKKQIGAAK